MTLDEAMGELQRRIVERRHGFKKTFDRCRVEQPVVPVGFKANELRRNPPAAIGAGPGRMAGARAGGEPLRRLLAADFDAAAAAHNTFPVIARESRVPINVMLPIANLGGHGMSAR